MTERLQGIVSMIGAAFVFAIMDASLKHLSTRYSPLQAASMRCFASLLLLMATIGWRRSWAELAPRAPWLHLLRGVLGVITLASFVYAVRALSLAETYALFLCAPLLMTALSVPIYGERVPMRRWLAIAAGLTGVILILRPGGHQDWGWLALIGICGALGQFWLTEAFRLAPPSVVGPFEYTAILWAFAIDWIFWSAAPTRALLAGAAIVIASGIFVIVDEHRLAQLAVTPASPPP